MLARNPEYEVSANGLPDNSARLYPVGSPMAQLRVLNSQRVNYIKARTRLTNQCFGLCWGLSGGEKEDGRKLLDRVLAGKEDGPAAIACLPLLEARAPLDAGIKRVEKEMAKVVKTLPVWKLWGKDVRGLGEGSFAKILAAAGDLHCYRNPAKLWKRMGLAVINGERQGKRSNAEEALAHGYNPQRRSDMWNLTASMGKLTVASSKADDDTQIVNEHGESVATPISPYGEYYLEERQKQRDKLRGTREFYQKMADERAKRHLAKRVLRDMWRAWRDLEPIHEPG